VYRRQPAAGGGVFLIASYAVEQWDQITLVFVLLLLKIDGEAVGKKKLL